MPRATVRSKSKAAAADAEKENRDAMQMELGTGNVATAGLLTLADELEEMTKKMNMVSLEKEKAEMLLKERDAELERKAAEEQRLQGLLESKDQESKKLAEKLRKLQKSKEFSPTIEIPLEVTAGNKDCKKKDTIKMKRPMTPFMLWCKEQRHQVKADNPDASFAEMSHLLSEKWKTVSEEDRKPYEERFKIEKDVYLKVVDKERREAEAMKLYQEEQNKKKAMELLEQYLQFKKEELDVDQKKKKQKDPEKPKKPTSGFFVFVNERRPAMLVARMKVTEIGKKLGDEWKTLDEKHREPYEKIAAQDKARYARELEVYKLKKAGELKEAEDQSRELSMIQKAQGLQLLKQKEEIAQAKKSLKDEKKVKKKEKALNVDPNKPKKPATSYLLYTMEVRKLIQQQKPGASFAEINATMAIRWQELPEAQKQIWVEKAAAARETYKIAMEQYNNHTSGSVLA